MRGDNEVIDTFDCFGSSCAVFVVGAGSDGGAHDAVTRVRRKLLEWHKRFSRFLRDSELSRLNNDLAKGLFADVLAEDMASHHSFAINCAGDLTIGGAAGTMRPIVVESPFDGRPLHTFYLGRTGVATSGIGRRSWLDASGRPAHHLLDPSTGEPAYTGIVQVTALAPTALLAEIRAKAALLSGPRTASRWLPNGGVIVFDDGSHEVLEPPIVITLPLRFGCVTPMLEHGQKRVWAAGDSPRRK
jgi:thiamine biosynthesis lipoprotein ApbE